jgi:predicted ATP-dependent endonuclease of OLD family
MQLKKLTLTQVRAFEQAEFDFQPGMNLLVGINGAGKSTVLDALRIILSQALPEFTAASRRWRLPFSKRDITVGRAALTAELHFEVAGISFEQLMQLREPHIIDEERDLAARKAVPKVKLHPLIPVRNCGAFDRTQDKG